MTDKLSDKYDRIINQLFELFKKTDDCDARMATICALLYHKFDKNFWVGFYFLKNGELTVKCYQGPLACQVLAKDKGAGGQAPIQQGFVWHVGERIPLTLTLNGNNQIGYNIIYYLKTI